MTSKSNILNLYDSVSGAKHYFQKVSTDQVELNSSDLPMNLKASQFNLVNSDGQSITNVVTKFKALELAIASEVVDRVSAIVDQNNIRKSFDDGLSARIDTEASYRQGAIATEETERKVTDTILQNAINTEKGAREGALLAEQTARSASDGVLQFNIDEEKHDRQTGDSNLSTRLSAEISERQAAIKESLNISSSGISDVAGDLVTEISNRLQAVAALDLKLREEVGYLYNYVNAEQGARSVADEGLATNIVTERINRLAEVKAERDRIDAMLAGSDVDLNQLKELVTAYQTSDNDILTQIGSIATKINNIQSQLNGLEQVVTTLVNDSTPPE